MKISEVISGLQFIKDVIGDDVEVIVQDNNRASQIIGLGWSTFIQDDPPLRKAVIRIFAGLDNLKNPS